MANQAELKALSTAACYTPPPLVLVYGPNPATIEQDGFQPGSDDDLEESFPLRDSYAESLAEPWTLEKANGDGLLERHRPRGDQHPGTYETLDPLIVIGPHHRLADLGGFRLRE